MSIVLRKTELRFLLQCRAAPRDEMIADLSIQNILPNHVAEDFSAILEDRTKWR